MHGHQLQADKVKQQCRLQVWGFNQASLYDTLPPAADIAVTVCQFAIDTRVSGCFEVSFAMLNNIGSLQKQGGEEFIILYGPKPTWECFFISGYSKYCMNICK